MRVFIAIDLPEEVRSRLGTVQRELRPVTTTARWVPSDSIHLTLKFIGEISDKQIDKIDEALAGLTWKPFQVTVQGVGFFPGTRSPRVFWAGLKAPTMKNLAEKIDSRLERFGFDKEKRAFRPHITLARARHTRLDTELVTAAADFEEYEFGAFTVERCFLYQSMLKSSGAVYTKLKEYTLNPVRALGRADGRK